jgi:hypothetical protein
VRSEMPRHETDHLQSRCSTAAPKESIAQSYLELHSLRQLVPEAGRCLLRHDVSTTPASLMLHGDADSDHDHCKRRQQTPWRNAVHTGANDCRCFVHGRRSPFTYPLDGHLLRKVNPLFSSGAICSCQSHDTFHSRTSPQQADSLAAA